MAELEIVATGLRFPEGPVAMADGSVILVEIAAGRITRVLPDGSKETVAEPGGGPNGLAIGPDGKLYCCNNGGFNYIETNGYLAPHGQRRRLFGRADRADRHRDRRGGGALQGSAISAACCAGRTTSCSTMPAASGSPITARRLPARARRRRHLLRQGRRQPSRGSDLPERKPQRRRPVARRQAALRGGNLYLPADGVQRDRAGQGRRHVRARAAPASRSIAPPATNSSIRSASRRAATSASRRSASAGSASSRRRASWSSSCRPTTSSPPTSAGAGRT